MNNILKLIIAALFIIGCDDTKYPIYRQGNGRYVPDSSKVKMREWIIKCVSATNYNMTGGDYEDPEDVVSKAHLVAEELFSINVQGLDYRECNGCMWQFIPEYELTQEQLKIFYSLKK